MRYVNYRNIRIHQIQIFLCAAECSNFTAAAEQMHVTQPMVSKTIQSLEQELGIILFRKDHGKLLLTPAGKELRLHWNNMMELFETSIFNAHAIQEAKNMPLRLGLGMSSKRPDINQLLGRLEPHIPTSDLLLECGNMASMLQRVARGDLDAALCSGHLLPRIQSLRLCCKRIAETSLAIYVPASNPLSQKESITFSDLKTEAFITYSPEADPCYWELLNKLTSEAGFRPKVACYVKDELSFQINLDLGRGVLLADSKTLEGPNIRRFLLEGTSCDLFLVWRGDNDNPSLKVLLDVV